MSSIDEKGSRKIWYDKMSESKKQWKYVIKDLSVRLPGDLKDVVEIQAEAISQRQNVVDEVNIYANNIHKLSQKMKVLTKERFEYYATSYQVKTSGTEKLRLIESDLSEYQLFINELDEHVTFLRDTSKNLDNVNYAIKNKIELANILGGYK
jgi:hypothetical protein